MFRNSEWVWVMEKNCEKMKKELKMKGFVIRKICPYCVGGYEQSVPYEEREQLETSATTIRNNHALVIAEAVGPNF